MRVFLTGASGFVGRALTEELGDAGHTIAGTPDRVDVTDADALAHAVAAARPDAVVHLAAVAYAPDAARDPLHAFDVNVTGTINLMEAVRSLASTPVVFVAGSSEVYGAPRPEDLPLREEAALRPRTPYGVSKAAQEGVALGYAARLRLRLVAARSFNHSGAGQRDSFVIPALARRVLDVAQGRARWIRVGNLDVRRDFTHVRDVVRAYRLLIEAMADGRVEPGGQIYNVASGTSVPIRQALEGLCALAGVDPTFVIDPGLVRPDDPIDIRGDASALRALTCWRPERTFQEMLADVWGAVGSRDTVSPSGGPIG